MDWRDRLKKLGINPTQLQWRWMNFQRSLSNKAAGAARRREQLAYKNKVCQGCGNILDQGDAWCPRCNVKAPTRQAEVARKAQPGGATGPSVTVLLLAAILLNEVIGMLAFGVSVFMKPTGLSLYWQGSMFPPRVLAGDWWRMITPGYLHIGPVHLLFNCMALYQCGILLEPEIGPARLFAVYTLCLLGGTGADLVMGQQSAGASGAISGLIGVGLAYYHLRGLRSARDYFLRWVAYCVVFDIALHGSLDNFGHAGGFAAGLLLGWVLSRDRQDTKWVDGFWRGLAALSLGVTLAAFGFLGRSVWAGQLAEQGRALVDAGQYEAALPLLTRALELDPGDELLEQWREQATERLRAATSSKEGQ